MKELKRQSLQDLHNIIHGEAYTNIRARLKQHLPADYAQTFSNIKIMGSTALWYTDTDIQYHPYAEATAEERELIAIWLEECQAVVKQKLGSQIPQIDSLFIIPSRDYIYWYRNGNDEVRVTLAAWGFREKGAINNVDVIGFLIQEPRVLRQQEVTIKFIYTDHQPAANVPFILNSFNNEQQVSTDKKGEYYLGKIFTDKRFTVTTVDGTASHEFVVAPDQEYVVTLDRITGFTISVVNQFGEPKGGVELQINGVNAVTNKEGQIIEDHQVMSPEMSISVTKGEQELLRFVPDPDPTLNVYTIEIADPVVVPTPPEKMITVILRDLDGSPLYEMPFEIYKDKTRLWSGITDKDGKAQLPAKGFLHGSKYKIKFKVTKEYRKKQQQAVQQSQQSKQPQQSQQSQQPQHPQQPQQPQ